MISPQECSAVIAYLNFLKTLNGKPEKQAAVKADVPLIPHREEKVGRPANLPRLKLSELMAQEPGYAEHLAAMKAAGIKPHREEKKGRPAARPRLKLSELMAQEPGYAEHLAAMKAAGIKPHREEKKGHAERPALKLAALLADEPQSDGLGEWDTGPAVGAERIWED